MKILSLLIAPLALAMPARQCPDSSSTTLKGYGRDNLSLTVYAAPSQMINVLDIYDNLLLTNRYVGFGAQMGVVTRPQGMDWYERAYNYPEFGLGLWWQPYASALEYRGESHLGNILNLYGYGTWDFFKGRTISFGPAARVGVSIAGSKYDPVTNPANLYIGTNLEYLVAVGFEAGVRLTDRFSFTLAAMGVHHSNGKQGIPNYGLNEVSLSVGAKYNSGPVPERRDAGMAVPRPEVTDRLTISPYLGTGFHSCERLWNARGREGFAPHYQRIMAGADLAYRYHPLFSSGIGVDMVYTPSVAELRACDEWIYPCESASLDYAPVYVGLSVFQRVYYKRVELHVKLGRYLYKRLGKTEDWGMNYQKIGFRYSFANHVYLGFDMLAVGFDSSDCLEFSIGYDITLLNRFK